MYLATTDICTQREYTTHLLHPMLTGALYKQPLYKIHLLAVVFISCRWYIRLLMILEGVSIAL